MILDTVEKSATLSKLNLSSLINPIGLEKFLNENWEKEPLIIKRGNNDFYKELFNIESVDKVLHYNRPTGNSIRVVQNQQPLLPSKYENPDGSLNLNQLYVAYGKGYTVVINEIQRYHEAIKQLCQNIKQELSHHVVANMYLTPPHQKALLPHYDTHDVLVIQVHGKKEWRIFDSPVETPLLHSHQPVFQESQLTGSQSVTLEAGDFMYMPRGVPHYAFTEDASSLHLTIGVHPSQWVDLFTEALQLLALQEVDFRKALPVGFHNMSQLDANQIKFFKEKFEQLMNEFSQKANPKMALGYMKNKFEKTKTIPGDGHFAQLDQCKNISLESKLQIRNGLEPQVYAQVGIARISFAGNTIKGPSHIQDALIFIAQSKDIFKVNDLPNISDDNKIKLIQRLIKGGLLKITQL